MTDWTFNVMHQIDLQTHEINSVLNKDDDVYLGVYVDTSTDRIIWSEQDKSQIFSSNLDGSDLQTVGDIGKCRAFSDNGLSFLECFPVDNKCRTGLQRSFKCCSAKLPPD